jgi:histone H2A
MRCNQYCQRISADAPVFLAAVLEYLCAELLEAVGEECMYNEKKRI